ncbi:hypothetical protein GQ42DRAFT_162589 [Ramicandelaber brevisporus]|nr:hypothetical protein GQ42DRAFT_162589 [Ramicandelaber brevisporus]
MNPTPFGNGGSGSAAGSAAGAPGRSSSSRSTVNSGTSTPLNEHAQNHTTAGGSGGYGAATAARFGWGDIRSHPLFAPSTSATTSNSGGTNSTTTTTTSASSSLAGMLGLRAPAPAALAEAQQKQFADKSERLMRLLGRTSALLDDLRHTNRNKWRLRLPAASTSASASASASANAHYADDMDNDAESTTTMGNSLYGTPMSGSMYATASNSSVSGGMTVSSSAPLHPATQVHPAAAGGLTLSVLGIDSLVGAHGAMSASMHGRRSSHYHQQHILASLEDESIAKLLDTRIVQAQAHIQKLYARVADKSSKVLVTGDLNAGKSTFVNALLRRDLLPVDQQPCTMVFCEVVDARHNGGVEEIHAIPDVMKYSPEDPRTFHKIDLVHLEQIVMEEQNHHDNDSYSDIDNNGDGESVGRYQMIKIYAADDRDDKESLLHNGVVDIALIDSPGLNRDSLKTTQLFARQEEIDVIVFVVNAENHFTLSGQEFLATAGKEKAYIFIVVNRFDAIRNKDRCRRHILEQIRELSPRTYEDAHDLVHFVSASAAAPGDPYRPPHGHSSHQYQQHQGDSNPHGFNPPGAAAMTRNGGFVAPPEFAHLENSLRSFILDKRAKSKLAPARRYLLNVVGDVDVLAGENNSIAQRKVEDINHYLKETQEAHQNMLLDREQLVSSSDTVLVELSNNVQVAVRENLEHAAANLVERSAELVAYPGILFAWQFANDVKTAMLEHVQDVAALSEQYAAEQVEDAVVALGELDAKYSNNGSAVDPAEALTALSASLANFSVSESTASLESTLGQISLTFTDFFDLNTKASVGVASWSLGSVALFATKLHGFHSVFGSLLDISSHVNSISAIATTVSRGHQAASFFSSSSNRRLVLVGLGALGLGLTYYLAMDMEHIIRRKLAHRIKNRLLASSGSSSYVDTKATYVANESVRAVRPIVWRMQSTVQHIVEAEERRRAEQLTSRREAEEAKKHFETISRQAKELLALVRAVDVVDDDGIASPISPLSNGPTTTTTTTTTTSSKSNY